MTIRGRDRFIGCLSWLPFGVGDIGAPQLRGWLAIGWLLASLWSGTASAESFYVNYSQRIDIEDVLASPRSILHPSVDLDLSQLTSAGHLSLGYLSIGEIAPDADYRARAQVKGVKALMQNEVWRSDVVDLTSPIWRDFVVNDLARTIAEKGFGGFFLDTMDAVDLLSQRYPDRAEAFRSGLISLIRDLRRAFPDLQIVVNRGFTVLDSLGDTIDGILVESVFGTFASESGTYLDTVENNTKLLVQWLQPWQQKGKDVYVLDYADPKDEARSREISQRASDLGFHSFVSVPALDGTSVAPLRRLARKVLVLYGGDPVQTPWATRYPFDSSTFLTLHMCFEWLGIEVEYLNAFHQPFNFQDRGEYRAILTDQTLVIPTRHEEAFVDSVLRAQHAGVKVLFAGHIPIAGWVQSQRLFEALGIGGTGNLIPAITSQRLLKKDQDMMDFKERVRLVPFNNLDLQAPPEAEVYLSLECRTSGNKTFVFDPVFQAPWGGILFEPYLFFTRPNFDDLWLLDPFKFLSRALDLGDFPVPDTTTREGVRLFYSHIDGDGFANISEVDPNFRSSEIIRDHILTKYPFPITYSVIEAEVEALSMLQKSDTAPLLREVARSIFALPNIQVASHSYSHPFYWIDDDPRQDIYDRRNLPMKNNYRLNLDREIRGSVEYIDRDLVPDGKAVELFLWSGNCRPSVAALKKVRELGILNMNGGDTLISTVKPSLSFVSPRTLYWGGELQILAGNQNENVYTHDWTGPFFGMYVKVIDTFEKTETPLRLKPVNVYFHNYCGDKPDGLQSLVTVFDWVQEQNLHAVTALQYAQIAKDSRFTALYRSGVNQFVMVNEGYLRTFRLPYRGRVPDMARSSGVTGFIRRDDFLYVHTDGRRRVSLVMVAENEASRHLYLRRSTGEIDWQAFGPDGLQAEVSDFRPVEIEIAGGIAGKNYTLSVADQTRSVTADAGGTLRFELPSNAVWALTVDAVAAVGDE